MKANKSEFARGGALKSSKLLAAMAILAVAFVVLAAVPAALTDSDATIPTNSGVVEATDATSGNVTWTVTSEANITGGGSYEVPSGKTLTIKSEATATLEIKTAALTFASAGTESKVIIDDSVTVTATVAVTIGVNVTLEGDIELGNGGSLVLTPVATTNVPAKVTDATVTAGNAEIKLTNVQAATNDTADDTTKLIIAYSAEDALAIKGTANPVTETTSTMEISGGTVAASGALTIGTAMEIDDAAEFDKSTNAIDVSAKGSINGDLSSGVSGSITLTGDADAGLINGTISTTNAKVVLTKITAGESTNLVITPSDGIITMKGEVDGETGSSIELVTGTLQVADNTADVDLTLGVKTTIAAGTTLDTDQYALTVARTATLNVYGSIDNTDASGSITNNGKIVFINGGYVSGNAIVNNGTISTSTDESGMSEVSIKGTIEGDGNNYGATQIVIIEADTVMAKDAQLTVKGKLVIPDGVTLTISEGAWLKLDGNARMVVEGALVIEEGAGESGTEGLNVSSGNVEVSGYITTAAKINLVYGTIEVLADGIVTVGEEGELVIADTAQDFIVRDSGTLTVNGKLDGTVSDEGTVVYDSEVAASGSPVINMKKAGAVVDVVAFTSQYSDNKTLTITDDGLVMSTYTDSSRISRNVTIMDYDKVVIDPVNSESRTDYLYTAGGMEFTAEAGTSTKTKQSTSTSVPTYQRGYNAITDKQYVKDIAVEGTLSAYVTYSGTGTASGDVVGKGKVTLSSFDGDTAASVTEADRISGYNSFKVKSELNVSSNTTLDISSGSVTVTGTVVAGAKDAEVTNTGSITVSSDGEVALTESEISSGISATKYVTTVKDASGKDVKTNHYVNINKALAVVSEEGSTVTELTLMANQTVSKDAELPTGVTLNLSTYALTVTDYDADNQIVFSIAEGATVKGSTGSYISVDDTLFAEDKSNVKVTDIRSNVKTEETDADGKAVKNGWAQWTNLAVALADATSGSVVKITGDEVSVGSNMTIADGVTMELPETSTLTIASGVTLTIDGVLKADGQIYAAAAFDLTAQKVAETTAGNDGKYSSAIVVTGKLMTKSTVTYGSGGYATTESAVALDTAPIAGLYYVEGDYSVIAGIDATFEDVSEIVGDITVNGKVTGGDYAVSATSDFYGIVVAKNSSPVYTGGNGGAAGTQIETILSVKSLTLDGITLDVQKDDTLKNSGFFTGTVAYADATVSASHATGFKLYEKDSKAYVSGTIDISAEGNAFTIASGKVYSGSITTVTTYTASERKETALTIASGAEFEVDAQVSAVGKMVVDGTLTVPATKTIGIVKLQVNGTVSVAAATATTSQGNLTVTQNMFVGISMTGTKVDAGASAVFNGPATLDSGAYAIVAADASVDDTFVDSVNDYSTVYNVDGSAYITAYASGDSVKIKVTTIPKSNVTAAGWASYAGGYDISNHGAEDDADEVTIGAYANLYALYETVIYDIKIIADEGVDNVYLNGQAMAYGMYGGTDGYAYGYYLKVAAGNYKVTYTLKNGYSGTASLALNGTSSSYTVASVSGTSFDVSGSAGTAKFQLTGIEKSGYVQPTEDKKDTGLTVTDYLLIVLVILVVVLAVIVAMRLMRS